MARPARTPGETGADAPPRPPLTRRRRLLAVAGAVVSIAMTVLWWVVVPEKADSTTGLQSAAIRWGHPACWALLTVVCVLVATGAPARLRNAVALCALACYAAFWLGLIV